MTIFNRFLPFDFAFGFAQGRLFRLRLRSGQALSPSAPLEMTERKGEVKGEIRRSYIVCRESEKLKVKSAKPQCKMQNCGGPFDCAQGKILLVEIKEFYFIGQPLCFKGTQLKSFIKSFCLV